MAGVLGVVPGILGLLQANEALKVLLGIGDTLAGRLLLFDALETEFTELKLRRDPNCPVCSRRRGRGPQGRPSAGQAAVGGDAPFLLGGPGSVRARYGDPGRRGARVSTVFIPSVLRANVGGVKSLEISTATRSGRSSTTLVERAPGARVAAADRRRRPQPVRQRLRQRPGRALPAGLETPVAPADEVRLLPAMAGG